VAIILGFRSHFRQRLGMVRHSMMSTVIVVLSCHAHLGREQSTNGKRMRDGWWVQGMLGFQTDMALEEDLVPRLLDAFSKTSHENAGTVRESLIAQGAAARELILWLDFLTFPLPTVVWVAGAHAAGKSSLVADLVDGSAICAADADAATDSVRVRGYRQAGTIVRKAGDGQAVHVTFAEFVEQWQGLGPDLLPLRFVDRAPLWPIDQVLLIDGPGLAHPCLNDAIAQYGLGRPAIVLFLINANTSEIGLAATADEACLRRVRPCVPGAIIHIILTKADIVPPARLHTIVTRCRQRYRELINGQVLVYSVRDGGGHSQSRKSVAGLLWQLTVEREDREQQALAERMSRHISARQQVFARLEALVQSLATQRTENACPSVDDVEGWYGRLRALTDDYRDLDMHLP
jgi:hypothetical protein